jgi:lysozyme family protein
MTINEVITDVMIAEGWDKYTNHPADRGGPTKWGITLKAWQDYVGEPVTAVDIQAITEIEARAFYRRNYVMSPNFHLLPSPLMELVIDCGVNHGTRHASKWLQKAVGVAQDGNIGPRTITAVSAAPVLKTYLEVIALRIEIYGRLVTKSPDQAAFAGGWNARAAKWVRRLADHI